MSLLKCLCGRELSRSCAGSKNDATCPDCGETLTAIPAQPQPHPSDAESRSSGCAVGLTCGRRSEISDQEILEILGAPDVVLAMPAATLPDPAPTMGPSRGFDVGEIDSRLTTRRFTGHLPVALLCLSIVLVAAVAALFLVGESPAEFLQLVITMPRVLAEATGVEHGSTRPGVSQFVTGPTRTQRKYPPGQALPNRGKATRAGRSNPSLSLRPGQVFTTRNLPRGTSVELLVVNGQQKVKVPSLHIRLGNGTRRAVEVLPKGRKHLVLDADVTGLPGKPKVRFFWVPQPYQVSDVPPAATSVEIKEALRQGLISISLRPKDGGEQLVVEVTRRARQGLIVVVNAGTTTFDFGQGEAAIFTTERVQLNLMVATTAAMTARQVGSGRILSGGITISPS